MALVKQNYPISFLQGLDTKDDAKQVIPGKLLALQNATFITPGELRKRNGYTVLSTSIDNGNTITAGYGLATFNNELIEFDGVNLYSYASGNMTWTDKGPITSLELSINPVVNNVNEQTNPNVAVHPDGLQLFTWEDSSGGSRYSIVDSVTGQTIVANALIVSTALTPKPFAIGAYLVIFYIDTATHHLRMLPIPVTDPISPLTAVDVATDVNVTDPFYDVCTLSTKLYIAYNSSGSSINLRDVNKFLVISAATAVTGENADVCITIFPDNTLLQLWIAYYNGTSVKYFVRNTALAAILPPTVVETTTNVVRIIGQTNSGSGNVWYEISASEPYNTLIHTATVTNTGVVGTPVVFLRSVGLAFKPFIYNTVIYFGITYQSVEQSTYFLVTSTRNIVGKILPTNGGGLLTESEVPEIVLTPANTYLTAVLQQDLLTTIGGTVYTQTGVTSATFDFLSNNTFYKAQMGANLNITGGILEAYDGVNVTEQGFNLFPEPVTLVSQATTGGMMGNAEVNTMYSIIAVYQWTDNQGQIWQSNTSTPISVAFNAGTTTGSAVYQIPTLRLTQKTGVVITLYRTIGNGTIYYQLTNIGLNYPLLNDPTVDFVTYDDTMFSDTVLQGNPIVYTTGGVVGNDGPPAPLLITQYTDRLILVPSENQYSFWYSKEVVPGTPIGFSALFVNNVDQRGGPITAVEQMDSALIMFKQNTIFYLIGEGPDNTGANNDYTSGQLITTDSGCINARSVVLMPLGILYQSNKGIYLLDRSYNVAYIGAPVEAYNGNTITSAQLIETTNQVRFTTEEGITLVYDYFVKQWSTFTPQLANDAVIFENEFTYVRADGLVYQETPGLFTDNGEFVQMALTTSWLSLAGLQGFQRAYRALFLGNYLSPHQLQIGVAYDFNPTQIQQEYINVTPLFSLTAYGEDSPYGNEYVYGGQYPLYQFQVRFARQKCEAIQFTIQDLQSSNFGEGFSISAFNLMVGTKKGSQKSPQPNIFG
jgi:hypothetical protein